jgi:hypothetical protein
MEDYMNFVYVYVLNLSVSKTFRNLKCLWHEISLQMIMIAL